MLRRIKAAVRRRRLRRDGLAATLDLPRVAVGEGDGAWVLWPEPLGPQSVVYSVGVGRDLSFDRAVVERFGCRVHAFDPTPRSVEWVATQPLPPRLRFHALGLAARDGELRFHAPRRERSAHYTPVARYRDAGADATVACPVRRLETLMHELGHDRLDLLKLDIEGGEYDVLDDLLSGPTRPTQLLVEFHHMYATIPYQRTRDTARRLLAAGYGLLHVSERTYEMSFVHRPGVGGG